jgi:Tfp pilus assembly protein PilP
LRLALSASGTLQSRQKALGILRGTQQVCCLQQAGQFFGWDQGDILGVAAAHNDNVVIVGDLVKD